MQKKARMTQKKSRTPSDCLQKSKSRAKSDDRGQEHQNKHKTTTNLLAVL
jgi:hypothetical protein